jgi:hypothetical protein
VKYNLAAALLSYVPVSSSGKIKQNNNNNYSKHDKFKLGFMGKT